MDISAFDPLLQPQSSIPQPQNNVSSLKACRSQYLQSIGMPMGLVQTFIQFMEAHNDVRLWLVDNSSEMLLRDSHLVRGTMEKLVKVDGNTRWEELKNCVAFHAQMSASCWIPTKFCLVNDPGPHAGPQKPSLCTATPADVAAEMETLGSLLNNAAPRGPNPLSTHLRNIHAFVSRESPRLLSEGKFVTLLICTQGLPTDERGGGGPAVIQEFKQVMYALARLPVKICFRLCTDDERAVDFYNTLDVQIESLDVLDDFWGEALEVYLHNPWLTYGLPLHRLREAGVPLHVMDKIDERPLNLLEIHQFGKCLLGVSDADLPDPRFNWNAFLHSLSSLLEREKQQWNPVLGKLSPWINVHKLNIMYGNAQPQYAAAPPHYAPPPTFHQPPNFPPQGSSPTGGQYRQNSFTQPHPSTHARNASANHFPQSMPTPPNNDAPNNPQNTAANPNPVSKNDAMDLKTRILQSWAMQPPQYATLRPLEELLGTVQTTFPPALATVEPHDYFGKWKPFSRSALGDGQTEVLKRAVRKAKFFLHPDKLPKDLTENQSILFKTIWDVIHDSCQVLDL